MSRLSVTVIAWNEEERLRACLESVAWADEIVVVDAESGDKTVQIAHEYTDKVSVRAWPGFAAQKNFAIDQATGDWILSLDADERVTPELRERVRAILKEDGPVDGYAMDLLRRHGDARAKRVRVIATTVAAPSAPLVASPMVDADARERR